MRGETNGNLLQQQQHRLDGLISRVPRKGVSVSFDPQARSAAPCMQRAMGGHRQRPFLHTRTDKQADLDPMFHLPPTRCFSGPSLEFVQMCLEKK